MLLPSQDLASLVKTINNLELFKCFLIRQGELQRVHHVLNECLIDRGASPSMVTLEVSVDGHHVTTAQVRMLRVPCRLVLIEFWQHARGGFVADAAKHACGVLSPGAQLTSSL